MKKYVTASEKYNKGKRFDVPNEKKAFTLAEAIMVLIVLGVVAVLTVPGTIHRAQERANRTKLQKALSVYDKVVNQIFIEQGITKSVADLNKWANDGESNCGNVKTYFNVAEDHGCIIKTTDGLWWDFGSERQAAADCINHIDDDQKCRMNNPNQRRNFSDYGFSNTIVAFKRENLTSAKATSAENVAFILVADVDKNGSIRVNDPNYAKQSYEMEDENGKKGVYGSRNNIQSTLKVKAYLENQSSIGWAGTNKKIYCYDCTLTYISGTTKYENYYDANGNLTYQKSISATDGTVYETSYTYDASGLQLSSYTTKNGKFSSSSEYTRDMYGNITSYHSESLNSYGNIVKSTYTQEYKYDDYGRVLSREQVYTEGSQAGYKNSVDYVRDEKGNITYYSTDTTQVNGNTSHYEYDYKAGIGLSTSNGSVKNTTNPNNSYTYTSTSKDTEDYYEDTYTYNYADGRVVNESSKWDNNTGMYLDYTYKVTDKNGNVTEDWTTTSSKSGSNTVLTYTDKVTGSKDVEVYDKDGNYLSYTGEGYYISGQLKYKSSDEYDDKGRITGSSSVNYDENGNKTSEYSANYTLDDNGRQTSLKSSSQNYANGTNSTYQQDYTYNSDGKTATQTYSGSGVAMRKNGTLYNYTTDYTYNYTYDEYGHQNGITYTYLRKEDGKVTSSYTTTTNYTYDSDGNITSTTYCKNNSCRTNSV